MIDGSKPALGKWGSVDGAPSTGPGKKKCPPGGVVMCGMGRGTALHLLCSPSSSSSASADNRSPEPSKSPAPAAVPAAPRIRLRRLSHFSSSFFHELESCSFIFSRSEEHTSELQSPYDLVCRLLLE